MSEHNNSDISRNFALNWVRKFSKRIYRNSSCVRSNSQTALCRNSIENRTSEDLDRNSFGVPSSNLAHGTSNAVNSTSCSRGPPCHLPNCCCGHIAKQLGFDESSAASGTNKTGLNNKGLWTKDKNSEPLHLRCDFMEAMLFPHLEKKTSKGALITRLSKKDKTESNRDLHRTTSDLLKELFCPAQTPLNVKLFGGKKAVEIERERSRNSGYVIHPCSKLRQYWDLVIMAMLVLNMLVLPLDIAFFTEGYDRSWIEFHVTSDLLCIIDIILNFRTGYQPSSEVNKFELDHKKIAKHYLKTWFALDIVSSLPFHYIILAASGQTGNLSLGFKGASRALKFFKVAKLLNLLKLLRLSRIIRGISQYEQVYCLTASFMRYIKLILMMLMVAHWNGCLHFLVPMLQDFPKECWVKLCHLENEPWYTQYGWTLFKTLSHMLCIGYGRFIPMLLSEAVITIFSMVTGATFYALFIAHSMVYIIQSDSSKNTYQEKFKQIDEYMTYRSLPESMKKRVTYYFEHKYHQGRFFDEQNLLSEISRPLRDEIVNHTCRDLVENVPFLNTGSPEFISAILNALTFEVYLSGDIIIKEGTVGSEMYFIRKGIVEVSISDISIANLSAGEYFGEICLLTGTRRVASVIAGSTCDLFVLSTVNLASILEEFPEMLPMFEHVAVERLLQLFQKCDLTGLEDARHITTDEDLFRLPSLVKLNDFISNAAERIECNIISHSTNENHEQSLASKRKASEILALISSVLEHHKSVHLDCDLCVCITKQNTF